MSPRPWKLCAALLYLALAAVGLARANAPVMFAHQGAGGGSAQVCLDGIAAPMHASLAFSASMASEDMGEGAADPYASRALIAATLVSTCALAQEAVWSSATSVWRYGSSGGPRAP
ncbi:MAG: hypothetical protein EA401_13385 [Planctomycetota bacterium]|nr:MAG: hypothetical protein EA401_13385 [Planctomycetota bacterium]